MRKEIKIFKSFEEHELFHLQRRAATTPEERFRKLYEMQLLTQKFHPLNEPQKRIIIGHRDNSNQKNKP